ncbi:hypothetical protein [Egicoccus sp. AB-alg2]|uniref:hypothetical protein n=1 Tax=Egicoccus sp. AB-alg2 TaxID=3242693 RepID=UPI00359EBD4C
MRRLLLLPVLAAALLLSTAGPAVAHAGLMPGDLAPGVASDSQLVVVHGCGPDGTIPANDEETLPTTAVTVSRPDGLTIVPSPAAGWTLTTDLDTDGTVGSATWVSDDPEGTLETIFLDLEVTADADLDGQQRYLPVVQDCAAGEQLAWVGEIPHEVDGVLPAVLVNVDASAGTTPAAAAGPPTSVIVTLAVAMAVLAGGGAAMITARRR